MQALFSVFLHFFQSLVTSDALGDAISEDEASVLGAIDGLTTGACGIAFATTNANFDVIDDDLINGGEADEDLREGEDLLLSELVPNCHKRILAEISENCKLYFTFFSNPQRFFGGPDLPSRCLPAGGLPQGHAGR